jgi:VanZ family protein
MSFIIKPYWHRAAWFASIIGFLWISVTPLGRTPLSGIGYGDKIAHFGVFFILALFPVATRSVSLKTVAVILSLVALSSELLQTLVPYRSAEIMDIAADLPGMFAGLTLGTTLQKNPGSTQTGED